MQTTPTQSLNRFGKALSAILLALFLLLAIATPFLNVSLRAILMAGAGLVLAYLLGHRHKQDRIKTTLKTKIANAPRWKLLLSVAVVPLIFRLVISLVLSRYMVQISDFDTAYRYSVSGGLPTTYVSTFPYLALYPTILHFFAQFFGDSQLVGFVFNSIICAGSSIVIFLLAQAIFKSKQISLAAALIYALWPGEAIFVAIYVPDHLATLLILLTLYFFVRAISYDKPNCKERYIYIALSAITCGCLVLFKDMSSIFLVAFPLFALVALIAKRNKRNIANLLCSAAFVLLTMFTSFLGYQLLNQIVGEEVNTSVLSAGLTTGIAGNDQGSFVPEYGKEYTTLHQNYSHSEANSIMWNNFSERLSFKALPLTLYNKAHRSLQSDTGEINWVNESLSENGKDWLSQTISAYVSPLNEGYYLAIIILMIIAAIAIFREAKSSGIHSAQLVVLVITIAICALLLIESQERYRYVIEPLYCLLAGYGLHKLISAKPPRRQRQMCS